MSHPLSAIVPKAKNTTEFLARDLFKDEGKEILGTLKHSELLINMGRSV
jgi:hypothetical protein